MLGLFVFAAGVAFLLYVLFLYPVLLDLRARWRSRPVRKRFGELKTVSVLLPVRNGEKFIRRKLESILALDYPRYLVEILVISDGSDDGTDEIAREFAPKGVELLRVPRGGKAVALNRAMAAARGDVLFFTDVRQPLAPDSLKHLVACLADPEVGAASGELVILDGETHEEANVGLYWKYEKWMRKRLSRIDSVIGATGCIYAMRRELAGPMPADTLLDDVHIPLRAFFRGYRVVLDESARAFDYPTSLDSEFRRKVRTLAGNYQLIGEYPALLGPRNRMWIHYMSHKFARLLMPYALIAVAAASFWLPGPFALVAVSGQAAFYCVALADSLVPGSWPLKRLSSPARTFVVLMAAALAAVSIFFSQRRDYWKETRVRSVRPLS